MNPRVRIELLSVVLGLVTLVTAGHVSAQQISAQQNSHVRIVRLSFAEGTVTIQRPDVSDWAKAPVNTPIQEGFKLSTGKDSFAEVEFENASTARLGELSQLEFNELVLTPSGGKVNRLTLRKGYATFHLTPERGDVYEIKAADGTLAVAPKTKAEFRADFDDGLLRVEVFKGSVEFSGRNGSVELTKKKVLELQTGSEEAYLISHGITKDSWDDWVAERDKLQAANRALSLYSSKAGSTYYGWNDLARYGSWSYFSGFGYGWVPGVPYGWSPFTLGRWVWYPGFGYTWVSYEPWGWLPYHYGNWHFEPRFGWIWAPGRSGSWCPATVNWYKGAGWIGWAPRSVGPAGEPQNCSQANGCVTAIPLDTFENGKPVTPALALRADPRRGEPVSGPDIAPTRLVRLPGLPVREGGAAAVGVEARPWRGARTGEWVRQPSAGAPPAWVGRAGGVPNRPAPQLDPAESSGLAPFRNRSEVYSGSHGVWRASEPSYGDGGGSISHSAPAASSGSFGAGRGAGGGFSGGGSGGGSDASGGSRAGGGARAAHPQ